MRDAGRYNQAVLPAKRLAGDEPQRYGLRHAALSGGQAPALHFSACATSSASVCIAIAHAGWRRHTKV